MTFPDISPIAFEIGPVVIRWYALAYISGFLLAWGYARHLNRLWGQKVPDGRDAPSGMTGAPWPARLIDDFMTWAILGVILGGRVGYTLFYNFDYYAAHPLHIIYLWEGGMSFHGGAAGVIIAIIAFALYHRINMFRLADIVCAGVPIGLFFGRLANFVNAELYGRVTNGPWGMVFPGSDGQPRYPSQLLEAVGEGLVLFIVLAVLIHARRFRERVGVVSAVFLTGYATARFMVEFLREPDVQLGTLSFGLTMGQTLCIPMVFGAIVVLWISRRYWVLTPPPLRGRSSSE
jgi:phosphatidylglycerol:prolipoprotein diacylglycerol transferase